MPEFARYYVEFLWQFWQNTWGFIKTFGLMFYKYLFEDIVGYFKLLGDYIGTFNVWSWILLIFVSALEITLVFFIVYRIVQLIRRFFIFRGESIEKDKLLEEIARLHEEAERLIDDKNRIFALKVNASGSQEPAHVNEVIGESADENAAAEKETGSRFTKLVHLDEKYAQFPNKIYMTDSDMISLS